MNENLTIKKNNPLDSARREFLKKTSQALLSFWGGTALLNPGCKTREEKNQPAAAGLTEIPSIHLPGDTSITPAAQTGSRDPKSPVEKPASHINPTASEPKIERLNGLGRTQLKISDIGLGTGIATSPRLISQAFDYGINYVDTAPDYVFGKSELAIGQVIKASSVRQKIIISTKFCTTTWHQYFGTSVQKLIQGVEQSLKRLQTDYVDILFVHSVDRLAKNYPRLKDPNTVEAFQKLKQAGKVKFLGLATHLNMPDIINQAVNLGCYDIILAVINFELLNHMKSAMAYAHQKRVGIIAMKVMGKYRNSTNIAAREAALKLILGQPSVDSTAISVFTGDYLKSCVRCSGQKFTAKDAKILNIPFPA